MDHDFSSKAAWYDPQLSKKDLQGYTGSDMVSNWRSHSYRVCLFQDCKPPTKHLPPNQDTTETECIQQLDRPNDIGESRYHSSAQEDHDLLEHLGCCIGKSQDCTTWTLVPRAIAALGINISGPSEQSSAEPA